LLKFALASVYLMCRIVFGVKQKDASSIFAFNFDSVYGVRKATVLQEDIEFSASKSVVGIPLIYRHNKIVLEARIAS
jgi:hypothetical protein